jgi:hypothetical protein
MEGSVHEAYEEEDFSERLAPYVRIKFIELLQAVEKSREETEG